MNKYVLVTAMILFAAISNTDAQNNQVKDFKMVEEGGSGPYKALVIADTAFEDFTVYRPNDLQAAVRTEEKTAGGIIKLLLKHICIRHIICQDPDHKRHGKRKQRISKIIKKSSRIEHVFPVSQSISQNNLKSFRQTLTL